MTNGRPLRFLALTLGGWTALRMLTLWQAAVPAGVPLPLPLIGRARASERASVVQELPAPIDRPASSIANGRLHERPLTGMARADLAGRLPEPAGAPREAIALEAPIPVTPGSSPQAGAITPPLRPLPLVAGRSRLAASAWLIARGGANGTLLGGQLGASQAGARITYAIDGRHHVALSARIATPLHGQGREAAFGVDWQPTRAPVHLIAEQRVSLDGGRGGPTLMAVGGIDPTPVIAGVRLEAYGEAGVIHRSGLEGFGDGAARLTRPLTTLGPLRVDLGAGSWGAVQRGARRLDVGPTLGVVTPLGHGARYRAVRLTLDWRERVAGSARPGSGPALSLGTDF